MCETRERHTVHPILWEAAHPSCVTPPFVGEGGVERWGLTPVGRV